MEGVMLSTPVHNQPVAKGSPWAIFMATHAIGEMLVARAGFEPAKLYAEDLESTPFDRSGTSPI